MDNFFDVDFFKRKCTIIVKHLNVIYSCCGAISYENFVRNKFQYFVIFYLCVGYFVCSTPPLTTLLFDSELHHTFNVFGFLLFINYGVINTYLLRSNRHEFHRLFDLINDYSNEPATTIEIDESNRQRNVYLEETNLLTVFFRIYQGLCLWYSMVYLGTFSDKIFSSEIPVEFDPETDYIVPFFCKTCNTTLSYVVAFNSCFFLGLPYAVFQNATLCFFMVISIYLKNRAVVLRNDIIFHSDAAAEKFESYDGLEEQELKRTQPSKFQLREINQLRERQVREFTSKIHRWIRVHQRLIACTKQYQKCAKKIIDLLAIGLLIGITIMGYFLLSYVMDGGKYIHQYIVHLMLYFTLLLVCCRIGNDLDDASTMISDAVYFMPWYQLPAKEQKTILIFLTISQRTHKLSVFGAFSLCLEIIPKNLHDIYGYIQMMRLLAMRSKD